MDEWERLYHKIIPKVNLCLIVLTVVPIRSLRTVTKYNLLFFFLNFVFEPREAPYLHPDFTMVSHKK